MRHNGPLRHKATKELLARAVKVYIPEGMSRMALEEQLSLLPDTVVTAASEGDAMEVETTVEAKEEEVDVPRTSVIPEVPTLAAFIVLEILYFCIYGCINFFLKRYFLK